MCIAAASILAKTYKDEYIKKLVEQNPDLNKYDLLNNSGYGTANHIDAIKMYGITEYHRKTFGLCKDY
jgi:ribonuclease HII